METASRLVCLPGTRAGRGRGGAGCQRVLGFFSSRWKCPKRDCGKVVQSQICPQSRNRSLYRVNRVPTKLFYEQETIWFPNDEDFCPFLPNLSFTFCEFSLAFLVCFVLFSCFSRLLEQDKTEIVENGIRVWLLTITRWLLKWALGSGMS